MESLAIKYRPHKFEDVVEQGSTVTILNNQLTTDSIKHCYLFCGGAGTGKTTCARIFANEVNNGKGTIIELDAASNNSVDDVRNIIEQAQTKPLEGKYKCFLIDECHALSNAGWQAFLKLIEEPPATAIFLFCTTDPQKIPKTIISRVQRYQFQRISTEGIINRLAYVLEAEGISTPTHDGQKAVEYIARIADGGMRDALTMLDKCLAYNEQLTLTNVMEALNLADYNKFIKLSTALFDKDTREIINIIEDIHSSGFDLKQFIKQYVEFLLDICKYNTCEDISYTQLPDTTEIDEFLDLVTTENLASDCLDLLDLILGIDREIKFSPNPKVYIESALLVGGRN